MNAAQFKKAFRLADSNDFSTADVDVSHLYGYGLPGGESRLCTIEQAAALLRDFRHIGCYKHESKPSWDMDALDDARKVMRRALVILD